MRDVDKPSIYLLVATFLFMIPMIVFRNELSWVSITSWAAGMFFGLVLYRIGLDFTRNK